MEIILDADVIISGEKNIFDLQGWLESRAEDQFHVAAITIAELWHGVERASGGRRASRVKYLEAVTAALPVIAYTEQTAHHHARLWSELEASGKMIGAYDLIVAATALQLGSTLATFNRRHFSQIKGLVIMEPKGT
ncbi:MAG TPA: PIN domain-containing protein [Acidobacteriaceae bacterium]|nr:PIN domain-containing protein [Acidobacteriaceae bacterium]